MERKGVKATAHNERLVWAHKLLCFFSFLFPFQFINIYIVSYQTNHISIIYITVIYIKL